MAYIVEFADQVCQSINLAGGKGANLARMSDGGLPVPPGFCVTTEAYSAFADAISLAPRVEAMLSAIEAAPDRLDEETAELRTFITAAAMPESIRAPILTAYATLEQGGFVAVRSSGTAEDLEGASFAGLHDTYLDVRGEERLLDAIQRCWASMWSARATFYRGNKGFDQTTARIAVVVQQMVEADVSGVMFTANPLTSATDEIVVNAVYGLGEALVSGIANPDEHILSLADLRVKEQRVGQKAVRIVRDQASGAGTVTVAVPTHEQQRYALSRDLVTRLGALGRDIMSSYGDIPQDIEWAIAAGQIYVLQSRPITGVDFSWDHCLEYWDPGADDVLWSRSWADETWNGAISPLTYSYRDAMRMHALDKSARMWGIKGGLHQAMFKYWKGEAYVNTAVMRRAVEATSLPMFRQGLLSHTAPDERDAILSRDLSLPAYLLMHARILAHGYGPYKWLRQTYDYLDNRKSEANGLSTDQLKGLSDAELCAEFEKFVALKTNFCTVTWTGFFVYARDAVTFLNHLVNRWYDGDNPTALSDILTGLPKRTATVEENTELWRLAQSIRQTPALRDAFEAGGPDFVQACADLPEARQFLDEYERFASAQGHRGHADRDLYFKRRCEDPSIDHANLTLLLSASDADPGVREAEVNASRNAAVADVEARLRQQPFGWLKARVFRTLLDYVHRFFVLRDDQRHYFDRFTFSMRRIALEIGARLTARGVFQAPEDAFFLGRRELYAALKGEKSDPLLALKLQSRRRNFHRMLRKEASPPAFIRCNKSVVFMSAEDNGDGRNFQGIGTSRGSITARARVVVELRDIGTVSEGEILITQSTDPGWTPVFNLISGIVLETGGMLAHGSCLAREYGLPAVQLDGATRRIPDGAVITLDGEAGSVFIHDEQRLEPAA